MFNNSVFADYKDILTKVKTKQKILSQKYNQANGEEKKDYQTEEKVH